MSGDINIFRIQQLINTISAKKSEESLNKEEQAFLKENGYNVDSEAYIKGMKSIGAESIAERKAVIEELSNLLKDLLKAVSGDENEFSEILNDVFNALSASSDPDVQGLVRLLQEALAKAKGVDISGKTEKSKLDQMLTKFIQCQMITADDYKELKELLKSSNINYNISSSTSEFGDSVETIKFDYNGKKYEFRTNQTGGRAYVGTGSWTSEVIKGVGLDLDGEDKKYFIGVYYNYYRFDPDAIREDFPGVDIETPAELKKAKDAKNNPNTGNVEQQEQTPKVNKQKVGEYTNKNVFDSDDLAEIIAKYGKEAVESLFKHVGHSDDGKDLYVIEDGVHATDLAGIIEILENMASSEELSDAEQKALNSLYEVMYEIDTHKEEYTSQSDYDTLWKLIDNINNNQDKYSNISVIVEEKEDNLCDITLKKNGEYYYNLDDVPTRNTENNSGSGPVNPFAPGKDTDIDTVSSVLTDIESGNLQSLNDLIQQINNKEISDVNVIIKKTPDGNYTVTIQHDGKEDTKEVKIDKNQIKELEALKGKVTIADNRRDCEILEEITADIKPGGNVEKLAAFIATNPEGWTFDITTQDGQISVFVKTPNGAAKRNTQISPDDVQGLAELCRWNDEQIDTLGLSAADKNKYLVKDGDKYKLNTDAIAADFKDKQIKTIEQLKAAIDEKANEKSIIEDIIRKFVSGSMSYKDFKNSFGDGYTITNRSDKKTADVTIKTPNGDKYQIKFNYTKDGVSLIENDVENDIPTFTLDEIAQKDLLNHLNDYFTPAVTKNGTTLLYTLKPGITLPGSGGTSSGTASGTDAGKTEDVIGGNTGGELSISNEISDIIGKFVSGSMSYKDFKNSFGDGYTITNRSDKKTANVTITDPNGTKYQIKFDYTYNNVNLLDNGVDNDIACYSADDLDKALGTQLSKWKDCFYCTASATNGEKTKNLYYTIDYSKLPEDLKLPESTDLDAIVKALAEYKTPEEAFRDAVLTGVTISGYNNNAKITIKKGEDFRDAFNALISSKMKANIEAEAIKDEFLGANFDTKYQEVYDATVDQIVEKYKNSKDAKVKDVIDDFIRTLYDNLMNVANSAPDVDIDEKVRAFIDDDVKPADILKDNKKKVGSTEKDWTYNQGSFDAGDVKNGIDVTINLLKQKLSEAVKEKLEKLGGKFDEKKFNQLFESTLEDIKNDYVGVTDKEKLKVSNIVDDFIQRIYNNSGIKEAEEAKEAKQKADKKLVDDARTELKNHIQGVLDEKDDEKTAIVKEVIGEDIDSALDALKTKEEIDAKKADLDTKLDALKKKREGEAAGESYKVIADSMESIKKSKLYSFTDGKEEIHTEFGIDSNGNIVFEQKSTSTVYNNLKRKLKTELQKHPEAYNAIGDENYNKLLQSAWIMAYNDFDSSTSHSTSEFISKVLENFEAIMNKLTTNPEYLSIYTAHTTYADDSLVNDLPNYKDKPTGIFDYTSALVNYKDEVSIDENGAVHLGIENTKYMQTMENLLERVLTKYSTLPETLVTSVFRDAQRAAISACQGNVEDCPYGTTSDCQAIGGITMAATGGTDWSGTSREDDSFHISMQALVQMTLYFFDKLLYKELSV